MKLIRFARKKKTKSCSEIGFETISPSDSRSVSDPKKEKKKILVPNQSLKNCRCEINIWGLVLSTLRLQNFFLNT